MFTALELNTLAVDQILTLVPTSTPARQVETFGERLGDAMRRVALLDRRFLFNQNLAEFY